MSAPTPATQPVKTKSKAYSSTVAIQGDAAKYRLKYKELKKKVREIEVENDKLHLKSLRIKRNIQRMRLERSILYERLEAESQATPSVPTYPPPPLPAAPSRGAADYSGYGGAQGAPSGSAYRHSAQPSSSSATGGRMPYASGYDEYAPPPPPRAHPHAAHHQAHVRSYAPSTAYDSRHHSPQPLPPPIASSTGDRAERLRQYTESPSPEPARREAGSPPPRHLADPEAAEGLPASSSSRSGMKVTLRRGA